MRIPIDETGGAQVTGQRRCHALAHRAVIKHVLLTGGKIAELLRGGLGGTGSQLFFAGKLQLTLDIDGLVMHYLVFARLARDGVGLRGNAVYTHRCMLGISNGSLVAPKPHRKPPSDN
ncbi:hypothetical protein FQZ97_1259070 [compost metagenome]